MRKRLLKSYIDDPFKPIRLRFVKQAARRQHYNLAPISDKVIACTRVILLLISER